MTIAEPVTLVGSNQVSGTPKGHEKREVPIPRFVVEQLAERVPGKAPDDLVFAGVRGGGALRSPIFRRAAFDRAVEAIGMPGLHPHELRRTAASLAIAAGADIKVVQMLGHKSATMTLEPYGHLFDDRLDDVADRLDAAADAYVAAEPAMAHLAGRWRAAALAREVPVGDLLDVVAAPDVAEARADLIDLWRSLGSLSLQHPTVLVLRYFDDLPQTESAAILGCSVGTAKSRTSRCA